jgi:hypothetical protein
MLLVIMARQGESLIDPTRYVADRLCLALLGVAAELNRNRPTEDDVSVLRLRMGASVTAVVELLETNATEIGLGKLCTGRCRGAIS